MHYVTTTIGLKANTLDVNTALGLEASKTDLTNNYNTLNPAIVLNKQCSRCL